MMRSNWAPPNVQVRGEAVDRYHAQRPIRSAGSLCVDRPRGNVVGLFGKYKGFATLH